MSRDEDRAAKRVAKARGVTVAEAIRQLVTEEDSSLAGTTRGETSSTASATKRGE